MRPIPVLVLASTLLAGCASSLERAADHGDYAALSVTVGDLHKQGKLTNERARDIAKIVARRELEKAKGEEALARLRDLRGCSAELEGALRDRMKTHDLAGAEAAMTLFEDGGLDAAAARAYLGEGDEAWRAIGTRTLVGAPDAGARRKAMVDPSPRVRRSAMRAAGAAKDPADLEILIDSARLDPDPFVRTDAVRAIALLSGERGPDAQPSAIADRIALVFRDLYRSGDDAVKEDIAASWAISPLWEKGGRDALRVLVSGSHGPGAVAGAGAIVRRPAPRTKADHELGETARHVLMSTIVGGSRRDRLHALAIVPLSRETVKAIKEAAQDPDPHVRVPALSRLLGWKVESAEAAKELESFAAQKLDRGLAARARIHLANAGDVKIQAWIEEDLRAEDPTIRLEAAGALSALGRSARSAPLLSDPRVEVRTRVACVLIAGAR